MAAGLGPIAIIGSAVIAIGFTVASLIDDSDLDNDLDDEDDLSDEIDWGKADYNHVLKGSKGTREFHGPGWKSLELIQMEAMIHG